jgi:hypothetical protein
MASEGERIRPAEVERPGENGVDLPAGKSAQELDPNDYGVVEIDDSEAARSRIENTHFPTPRGDG